MSDQQDEADRVVAEAAVTAAAKVASAAVTAAVEVEKAAATAVEQVEQERHEARRLVAELFRDQPPMTGRFRRHAALTAVRLALIAGALFDNIAAFSSPAYDDIFGFLDVRAWGVVLLVTAASLMVGSIFQFQWFARAGLSLAVGITAMWSVGLFTAWQDGRGGALGLILVGFYGLKDLNMLLDAKGTFVHVRQVDR